MNPPPSHAAPESMAHSIAHQLKTCFIQLKDKENPIFLDKIFQKSLASEHKIEHYSSSFAHGVCTFSVIYKSGSQLTDVLWAVIMPGIFEDAPHKLGGWIDEFAKNNIACILLHPHIWSHNQNTHVDLGTVQRGLGVFLHKLLCSPDQFFFQQPRQNIFMVAQGSSASVTLAALSQSGMSELCDHVVLLNPIFGGKNRFFMVKTFINVILGIVPFKTFIKNLLKNCFFITKRSRYKIGGILGWVTPYQHLARYCTEQFRKNFVHRRLTTRISWIMGENDPFYEAQYVNFLQQDIPRGHITLVMPELTSHTLCTSSKVIQSVLKIALNWSRPLTKEGIHP